MWFSVDFAVVKEDKLHEFHEPRKSGIACRDEEVAFHKEQTQETNKSVFEN